ncbi:MAG: amino acid adenylation domain-containing protein [Pseudomonadales bacterium]
MAVLQDLVSSQVERTPEAIALEMQGQTVSYARLEAASNRLANLLLELGCARGDRVCLFLPKGIDAVVGMLGTLKAGGVYVPIDLDSPAARVRRVVQACEPFAALVDERGAKLLAGAAGDAPGVPRLVAMSGPTPALEAVAACVDAAALTAMPDTRPASRSADESAAHILFTSGSTGVPKGVVITHANVAAFLDWACEYFGIEAGKRISGHPPLHFDLSTFDIYGTLSRGATLCMVPPALNLLAPKLAQFIRDARLNQWFSVPSILTYLANFDVVAQGDFPHLERLLWCGEVLPTPTLTYWMERLPHVTFTNLYGPTEATIASSYFTVTRAPKDELEDVPIGAACTGEELLVLDEALAPVGVGVVGDIYIRGAGLSPGYWRDAATTAAAFVANPADPDDRLYRTGDRGWIAEDGLMRYVGRADSQIKSRGYRIEPGEIEAALSALGYLRESAVVGVRTGGFENWAICCAYVPTDPAELAPAKLRRDLMGALPSYMLPAHWRRYPALPKNANGKIDRRAIRERFEAMLAPSNPSMAE